MRLFLQGTQKQAAGLFPRHLNKLLNKPYKVSIFVSLVEDSETEEFGDYCEYVTKYRPKTVFYSIPTPDRGVTADGPLFDMVYHVYKAVKAAPSFPHNSKPQNPALLRPLGVRVGSVLLILL